MTAQPEVEGPIFSMIVVPNTHAVMIGNPDDPPGWRSIWDLIPPAHLMLSEGEVLELTLRRMQAPTRDAPTHRDSAEEKFAAASIRARVEAGYADAWKLLQAAADPIPTKAHIMRVVAAQICGERWDWRVHAAEGGAPVFMLGRRLMP